jgi:SAM-dependent methyltransferase
MQVSIRSPTERSRRHVFVQPFPDRRAWGSQMRYSYVMPAGTLGPSFTFRMLRAEDRRADTDRRWPSIVRCIAELRENGRRAIRIVDVHCGAGTVLIAAARRARALGFVAIEARGVDSDPRLIGRASAAARGIADPAMGFSITVGDAERTLIEEAVFRADIVLYSATGTSTDMLARAAGDVVLRAVERPAAAVAA